MSRIPPAVVAEVEDRAGWGCEACGFTITGKPDLHHRHPRGMGGSKGRALDVAVNLLRLHQRCHSWIHAHPHAAETHGWIVRNLAEVTTIQAKVNPSLHRWAA